MAKSEVFIMRTLLLKACGQVGSDCNEVLLLKASGQIGNGCNEDNVVEGVRQSR